MGRWAVPADAPCGCARCCPVALFRIQGLAFRMMGLSGRGLSDALLGTMYQCGPTLCDRIPDILLSGHANADCAELPQVSQGNNPYGHLVMVEDPGNVPCSGHAQAMLSNQTRSGSPRIRNNAPQPSTLNQHDGQSMTPHA